MKKDEFFKKWNDEMQERMIVISRSEGSWMQIVIGFPPNQAVAGICNFIFEDKEEEKDEEGWERPWEKSF